MYTESPEHVRDSPQCCSSSNSRGTRLLLGRLWNSWRSCSSPRKGFDVLGCRVLRLPIRVVLIKPSNQIIRVGTISIIAEDFGLTGCGSEDSCGASNLLFCPFIHNQCWLRPLVDFMQFTLIIYGQPL